MMRRLPLFVFVLFLSWGLSSCLDLTTGIVLRRDGSLKVKLTYVLDSRAAELGRLPGAQDPWPLPLSEGDFAQRALQTPGVELKRYRFREETTRQGEEKNTIEVSLEAQSVQDLAAYFRAEITLEEEEEGARFLYRIPASPEAGLPLGLQDKKEILEGITLHFSLRPPRRPRISQPGTIENKQALWTVSLGDLLAAPGGMTWRVEW